MMKKFQLLVYAAAIALSACATKTHHTQAEPEKPAYTVMSVIHFATSSAALNRTAKIILGKAAARLKKDAALQLEIAGHADSRSTDAFNMALSKRRADRVNRYLVKHGVSVDRLTVKAYGESQPVVGNDSTAGMAKNRRVELRTR